MSESSYIPEISYTDTDPDNIKAGILSNIETNLGRQLYPADPLRLFALAFAAEDVNIRNLIDEAGRQNLLAYASGTNLDALGDLIGVSRLSATGATTTLRFTAGAPAAAPITIPAGTRATPDGSIYFATDYAATIQTGQTSVDVPATCTTTGPGGNGFISGEIDQAVDPVAYVPNVSNIVESSGGADTEDDEAYRERIRLGVTRFSVAGPRDAYEFWARSASVLVSDVFVNSPTPGYVDVYVILQGGEIPEAPLLAEVQAVLESDTIRPLTDFVTAKAPTQFAYTLTMTYYIRTADQARASEIQTAVTSAVNAWKLWQRSAIGRDLNPSELIARVMNAGAKRVTIASPVYTVIPDTSIAVLSGVGTVTYGGLEDD
ncbi:MAG: baseplate assembly protein [Armatimonadota bacterium]